MSAILLRKSLKKLFFKSFYQLTKNRNILTHNDSMVKKSKTLLQKQLISNYYYIIRCGTSKSITIKEYKTSRKYSWNWKLERLMGWSLAIMIPLAFAVESNNLEMALGTAGIMHNYWGCQSMCSDYLRTSVVGKVLPIVVRVNIVLLTIASLAGIYQIIYEDVGLVNMVKKIWSIRGQDYVPPKLL